MRTPAISAVVLAASIALTLTPSPAQSQPSMTWVSGTGRDIGNCESLESPCREISHALTQTAPGGTINVLPGSYLTFIVTQAVEIIAEQGQAAIRPSGADADGIFYAIKIAAGAGDTVRIRGININQRNTPEYGGIYFGQGAALHLENCTMVRNAAGPALNIATSTTANITVRNTTMSLNGGGNVQIRPTNNALVVVTFDNVLVANSPYGIRADNSGGSGKIIVDVKNSIAKGNANNGYLAVGTGASPVHFMLDRATAESNGAYGAVATGPQAFMIVGNSTLMSNGTGLAQLNGATVASTGTNTINFNTTNTAGTITPIAPR